MLDVVCDLSHHNTNPDYAAAAAYGVKGVFYKATQGTASADPTFADAEKRARAAGLWWGAYHFATGEDAVAQADWFLSRIPNPATTLMALDFEPNPYGATMTLEQARAFVTHVQARTGRWSVLYSGSLIKEQLGDAADATLVNCPLWLAQYGPKAVVPRCWPTWTFWQYSDGLVNPPAAPVPGFGHCDRDRFNGDLDQLARIWPH